MIKSSVLKTDYSKIADYYDKVRPMTVDVWLSKIIEYGNIDANCAVLDVGCGTGRFTLGILTAKNSIVCGLEPSIEMLKRAVAKDKSRNILWICGDGQKLPLRDARAHCEILRIFMKYLRGLEP